MDAAAPSKEQVDEVKRLVRHRIRRLFSSGGYAYSLALCLPADRWALLTAVEVLHEREQADAPSTMFEWFVPRNVLSAMCPCELAGESPEYWNHHCTLEEFALALPELVFVARTQAEFDHLSPRGPDRNTGGGNHALVFCVGFIPTTPLPHQEWSLVGGTLEISRTLDARDATLRAEQTAYEARERALKEELAELADKQFKVRRHRDAYFATRQYHDDPY